MNNNELVKLVTEIVTNILENKQNDKSVFYVDDFECSCILNNYDLNQNVKDILSSSKSEIMLKLTDTTALSAIYEQQLVDLGFRIVNSKVVKDEVKCLSSKVTTDESAEVMINKKIIDEKSVRLLDEGTKIFIKKNSIITALAKEQITKRNIKVVREK